MTDEALPFVTVIMPIRNEAGFIERAIRSVLNNDYPPDKMEILVVDGMSNDGTREIVERLCKADNRVKLLNNPAKIQAVAMNIGIKACRGEIFIRVDGHADVPPDFIKKSMKCLSEHPDAWVVGGYWKTVSQGYVGKVIAAATQCPMGVGNAKHRLGNFDGWVDTVPYGAHHKWILDKVGCFDEELVRSEDDEFNNRVLLAGGKIWLSSSIWSTYYARSSLKKLWRQYFQDGFWRTRTLQKHGKPAAIRRVVPLLFISSLAILALAGIPWVLFRWMLAIELGAYAVGLVYGSIDVGRRAGWKHSLLAPVVFAILHFAYGLGCLWGIVRFILLRGKFMNRPGDAKLSR
jgi:glycosyltransferase involved in cell wall biosynthesis